MVTYARRTGANALHNLSNIFRSTVHSTLHRDSAVRSLSILEERRQTGAQLPKGKFLLWEGMFLSLQGIFPHKVHRFPSANVQPEENHPARSIPYRAKILIIYKFSDTGIDYI